MRGLGLLALGLALIAQAAQGCELPGGLSIGHGPFTVAAVPDPSPIEVGKPFSLTLAVCPVARARIVGIDAQMPVHRHGMNYAPRLTDLDGGRVRAEGLLFHMPGLWRLTVTLDDAGKRHYVTLDLELE